MIPANYHSSRITVAVKDSIDFGIPEPVSVYADIIKPNLFGEFYVRIITTLRFPSNIGYHGFNYPLYILIEQIFMESITIRLATKYGEVVLFEDIDILCLYLYNLKRSPRRNSFQCAIYNESTHTVLGQSRPWWWWWW